MAGCTGKSAPGTPPAPAQFPKALNGCVASAVFWPLKGHHTSRLAWLTTQTVRAGRWLTDTHAGRVAQQQVRKGDGCRRCSDDASHQRRKKANVNGAVPDPGGRRRCGHMSSFQHPKLSHFCQMNYVKKGTLVPKQFAF